MKKYSHQSMLRFLLVIGIALSTGCAPSTMISSSTQRPTALPASTVMFTVTPRTASTPQSIYPKGKLIYSDSRNIIEVNIQSQEEKTIFTFTTPGLHNFFVVDKSIYIINSRDSNPYLSEIVRVNDDDKSAEQILPLTQQYEHLSCFGASPNKRYLLCGYGGSLRSILIVDIETKSIQTISPEANHSFLYTSWSLDSQKMYFLDVVYPSFLEPAEQGRLLEFSLETNRLSELLPALPNPRFRWDEKESPIIGWSPDGTNLLINLTDNTRKLTENFDRPYFYIFNINNKSTKQIKVDGQITHFEWSPDGAKIALEIEHNYLGSLFVYDIATGRLQKIPAVDDDNLTKFAWSPNGKYILYSTYQGSQIQFYLLSILDDEIVQVTPGMPLESGMNNVKDFIWSPNGNKVLFVDEEYYLHRGDVTTRLYMLDINTKRIVLIEKQFSDSSHIFDLLPFRLPWSVDGKYFLFFTGPKNGVLNIQNSDNVIERIEIKISDKALPGSKNVYWIQP